MSLFHKKHEFLVLPPNSLPEDVGEKNPQIFAKQLQSIQHDLTQVVERGLRSNAAYLMAAYVVLSAVAHQEDKNTAEYIVLQLTPKVKEKGKKITYVLKQLTYDQIKDKLIAKEEVDGSVDVNVGDPSSSRIDINIGEKPVIDNATLGGKVVQITGVYTTSKDLFDKYQPDTEPDLKAG